MLPVQRETGQNGNRRNQSQQRAVHQAMEPPKKRGASCNASGGQ